MKFRLLRIAMILTALLAFAFLVIVSGIIPLKASSGHWRITRWFLHFSMKRSVVTHSLGVEPPSLSEPWLMLKGARYYDIGCSPCHGNPILRSPRIPQQMTPRPPYLPSTLFSWDSQELFYIVKHGIKFTGMPAWPTQKRDDEVWAVVAFLRKLPELNQKEYLQLARGELGNIAKTDPETTPPIVNKTCGPCHGIDGLGEMVGAFPRLAGQKTDYLLASLQAFARSDRYSGIMEPIAAQLDIEEMIALANYYGRLKRRSISRSLEEEILAVQRGKLIAIEGIPNQRIPPCVECHGPSSIPKNQNYPLLAGQHFEYIVLQLELFQSKRRGGTAYARLMRPFVDRLTSEQIRDVAFYYSSLSAE